MAVYLILGVLITMLLVSRATSGGSRTSLRRTDRHRDGGSSDPGSALCSGSDSATPSTHASADCAPTSDGGSSDGGCSSDGGGSSD